MQGGLHLMSFHRDDNGLRVYFLVCNIQGREFEVSSTFKVEGGYD